MIKTMDRYLLKESIVPMAIGTIAVVLMLLGGILYDNADKFFGHNVPISAVAQLLMYRIPYLLVLTLPAGTVVGVSLNVSRLSRDSEITVLRSAGVSLIRILAPLFFGALLISCFDYYLEEKVMPTSQKSYQDILNRVVFLQPQPNIRPNVMFQIDNYGFIIGMANQEGKQVVMHDITIFEKSMYGKVTAFYAKSGVYDSGVWKLNNALIYQFDAEGNLVSIKSKDTTFNLREDFGQLTVNQPPEALTREALAVRIAEKRRQKLNSMEDEVNFHSKLAIPAACFFLALISPVLSLLFSRSGSFVGVLLSIVLVFVYWNTLLLFVKILGSNGFLPPILAAWMPNIIFGAVGLLLLRNSE